MPYKNAVLEKIVLNAIRRPIETPWIEFKENNSNTTDIGEYISALSNTAALYNKNSAFMIWGINNETHDIVGTSFRPSEMKKGNESLALWLSKQLTPKIQFYLHDIEIDGFPVVVLEIYPATSEPVKFSGVEYIRIDTNKKKLKDYPEIERELWTIFSRTPFETMIALENVTTERVLQLIDHAEYFNLLNEPIPSSSTLVINRLVTERMLIENDAGSYDITNLGAILFSNNITEFPSLSGKTFRLIAYSGNIKTSTATLDLKGTMGYALGFEGLISNITNKLPRNEVIGAALRKNVLPYPELAIRELVANAMIHQNFLLHGTAPSVEIFPDRIEFINPGIPLIEKVKFIGSPPVSRNEALAHFMYRIGICEMRGSGFARVIEQVEHMRLPAPNIEILENHTKVTLFAHKEYTNMSKDDRIRACYDHACIRYFSKENMTNASLRERLNIDEKNTAMVSRLLKEALATGLIKVQDETVGTRARKYIPFWV